jgi:hypothetical protein
MLLPAHGCCYTTLHHTPLHYTGITPHYTGITLHYTTVYSSDYTDLHATAPCLTCGHPLPHIRRGHPPSTSSSWRLAHRTVAELATSSCDCIALPTVRRGGARPAGGWPWSRAQCCLQRCPSSDQPKLLGLVAARVPDRRGLYIWPPVSVHGQTPEPSQVFWRPACLGTPCHTLHTTSTLFDPPARMMKPTEDS